MNFRKYKKKDYKFLLELFNECFNHNYTGSDIKASGNIFVLEDNNIIVGMVTIDVITNIFKGIKYGYVNDVCVSNKYRGKGYGKILMLNVDKFAKDNGLSYIMLTSSNKRKIAQSLYRCLGYDIVDTCLFKNIF